MYNSCPSFSFSQFCTFKFEMKMLQGLKTVAGCNLFRDRDEPKRIEYILEWNLLEKSVKRPFCCTFSILQVYFTYFCYITFWALVLNFIENLKLILKENQIMKQAGFIIEQRSFHIDSMLFTLHTMIFHYNYKSNDVFSQLIHFIKFI